MTFSNDVIFSLFLQIVCRPSPGIFALALNPPHGNFTPTWFCRKLLTARRTSAASYKIPSTHFDHLPESKYLSLSTAINFRKYLFYLQSNPSQD
jgi:hypothetical protein